MTAGETVSITLGRIVRPADYVRVLAAPMRLRSPHFAVHHLEGRPLPPRRPGLPTVPAAPGAPRAELACAAGDPPDTASLPTELSTRSSTDADGSVDDLCYAAFSGAAPQRWLGLVVPKRHAKRAVTRSLIKRQIRSIAAGCAGRLPAGLWVVRLRAPFDPKQFPSAASEALRQAAHAELLALFERAARGERDVVKSRPRSAPEGGPANAPARGGSEDKPRRQGNACTR
jgi:ribonuclease P protein component